MATQTAEDGGAIRIMSVLEMRDVTKKFGGLAAVSGLNLVVEPGELLGLIGPNGAGKTTVFNLITGVYKPSSGDVLFQGMRVNGLRPCRIASFGICRTFQNIRLFKQLNVLDNVRIAAHLHTKANLLDSILRNNRLMTNDRELTEFSLMILRSLKLEDVSDQRSSDLPYGLQRRLEIARAIATKPRLLLLDEPAAGMNPQEKVELMELVRSVRRDYQLTILLIEHDMRVVMGICERIYVLDYGELIAEGKPEAIRKDPRVLSAYLGE